MAILKWLIRFYGRGRFVRLRRHSRRARTSPSAIAPGTSSPMPPAKATALLTALRRRRRRRRRRLLSWRALQKALRAWIAQWFRFAVSERHSHCIFPRCVHLSRQISSQFFSLWWSTISSAVATTSYELCSVRFGVHTEYTVVAVSEDFGFDANLLGRWWKEGRSCDSEAHVQEVSSRYGSRVEDFWCVITFCLGLSARGVW